MRSDEGHGAGPVEPPWSVEVLADLHAGVHDEQATRAALARIRSDAAAQETLEALEHTRAAVARLGRYLPEQAPHVPADVAARLDAALAAEPRPPAPMAELAAARRRRNRVLGWGSGAVAVAAAVLALVLVVVPGPHTTPGHGVAAPGAGRARVALGSGQLGRAALGEALGRNEPGPFTDRQKRRGCLRANSVAPGTTVLGTAQVTRGGRPGTLFVLTTGRKATFRLLVVGEACAAGNAATLTNSVVGPK